MKLNKKDKKILEKYFNIYEDNDCIDLESWTGCGVNMFICFDKEDSGTIAEHLSNYISEFDIDEEIEIHRQGADYKRAFSIRQSLEDFEDWLEWVKDIQKELIK